MLNERLAVVMVRWWCGMRWNARGGSAAREAERAREDGAVLVNELEKEPT